MQKSFAQRMIVALALKLQIIYTSEFAWMQFALSGLITMMEIVRLYFIRRKRDMVKSK